MAMADDKPRRGGGPKAVSRWVGRVARPAFARRGFAAGAVITDWADIVGEMLARHTCPEKLVHARGAKGGGTLRLRVDSGALAPELQHLEPQLIERINGYFGYQAVARIALVQGPLPPRPQRSQAAPRPLDDAERAALERKVAGVEDEDLRNALLRLGTAVRRRKSRL